MTEKSGLFGVGIFSSNQSYLNIFHSSKIIKILFLKVADHSVLSKIAINSYLVNSFKKAMIS